MKSAQDGFTANALHPTEKADSSPNLGDDPQVLAALEEYLAAVEAGQRPNRQEFLARHGAIAEPLAKALEGLEFIQQAASRSGLDAGAAPLACPDPVADLSPLGDYRIVREIGRGGMGVVYEAVQLTLGRRVALKVLPFAAALDPRHLQRFHNEAHAAAHLRHTHIVPVFGVGCERGIHYYAMQFIEGQSLASLIALLRREAGKGAGTEDGPLMAASGSTNRLAPKPVMSAQAGGVADQPTGPPGPLPATAPAAETPPPAVFVTAGSNSPAFFRTVAQLGIQAAEALEHAHQMGVIHRDIKPGNLLVDGHGNLWVTDFGLAQFQGNARLTMTGDVLGTLRYMSPEQAQVRSGPVDHRTDIYALGATLYELLTLEPAFPGSEREEVMRQMAFEEPVRPRRWNPAIPTELETIVLKALAKEPDERYATAQELADDLRRFLEDKPIRARRPTLGQVARQWARRHRGIVVTAAVAAGLLLAFLVAGLTYNYLSLKAAQDQIERAYNQEREHKQRAQKIVDLATETFDYMYLVNMQPQLPREQADRLRWEQLVKFYRQVARSETSDPEVRKVVARAFNRMAIFQWQLGAIEEARKAHREAIARTEQLVAEFPENRSYRTDLASCRDSLAAFLRSQSDRVGTVGQYRAALDLWKRLVADFPDDLHSRENLAADHKHVALLQTEAGQWAEAKAHWQEAVKAQEELAARFPQELVHQLKVAEALTEMGRQLWQHGEPRAATDSFRRALELWTRLARDAKPSEAASTANALAWFLATCPDPQLRNATQAVEWAKKAVGPGPQVAPFWNTLGVAQYRAGDPKAAVAALQKSMQLRGGGDATDWFFLAMACWKLNDPEQARSWYQKAVRWMDQYQVKDEELRGFRAEAAALLGL
jgi:serine/threonine protein kinase/tetratricopeptide (TPR) repeat protein